MEGSCSVGLACGKNITQFGKQWLKTTHVLSAHAENRRKSQQFHHENARFIYTSTSCNLERLASSTKNFVTRIISVSEKNAEHKKDYVVFFGRNKQTQIKEYFWHTQV